MSRNPDFDAVLIKKTEIERMEAEIERLRAALTYYADKTNYAKRDTLPCAVIMDCGEEARRALETKPCQRGLIPDERVEGPRRALEPEP